MEQILIAAGLFSVIFSVEYLRSVFWPRSYQYVSYETYFLYIGGLIAVFWLFHSPIFTFAGERLLIELGYLLSVFLVAIVAAISMRRQNVQICMTILRSAKCISPLYILIKTKELLFQQLLFLVLALGVSREIGTDFKSLLVFIIISLLIQIPLVLHVKPFWRYVYVATAFFASVIFFYTYISLGLFWPAVYIHAIIYTFYWITLAEPSLEV